VPHISRWISRTIGEPDAYPRIPVAAKAVNK